VTEAKKPVAAAVIDRETPAKVEVPASSPPPPPPPPAPPPPEARPQPTQPATDTNACPTCGRKVPGLTGKRYCMVCDHTF